MLLEFSITSPESNLHGGARASNSSFLTADSLQGCHVPAGETIWFRDHRPGGLFEAGNTFDQVCMHSHCDCDSKCISIVLTRALWQRASIDGSGGQIKDDAGAFRTEVVFGDGVVKRKKSNSWRNSKRAPDDLIEIPIPKGETCLVLYDECIYARPRARATLGTMAEILLCKSCMIHLLIQGSRFKC
jgi:hypothetical protein